MADRKYCYEFHRVISVAFYCLFWYRYRLFFYYFFVVTQVCNVGMSMENDVCIGDKRKPKRIYDIYNYTVVLGNARRRHYKYNGDIVDVVERFGRR